MSIEASAAAKICELLANFSYLVALPTVCDDIGKIREDPRTSFATKIWILNGGTPPVISDRCKTREKNSTKKVFGEVRKRVENGGKLPSRTLIVYGCQCTQQKIQISLGPRRRELKYPLRGQNSKFAPLVGRRFAGLLPGGTVAPKPDCLFFDLEGPAS